MNLWHFASPGRNTNAREVLTKITVLCFSSLNEPIVCCSRNNLAMLITLGLSSWFHFRDNRFSTDRCDEMERLLLHKLIVQHTSGCHNRWKVTLCCHSRSNQSGVAGWVILANSRCSLDLSTEMVDYVAARWFCIIGQPITWVWIYDGWAVFRLAIVSNAANCIDHNATLRTFFFGFVKLGHS